MNDGQTPVQTVEETPAAKTFALIARQPIYDPDMAIVAYELLFRKSAVDATADVANSRQATLMVIETALEIGLGRLTGGLPVHINFPRELLVAVPSLPLPPERVVIEVLEDVPGDPQVIAALAALRARGHRIALDDYSPQVTDPALLDVADIVKIVVSQVPRNELVTLVNGLKARGVELIAEEVETVEQFEQCLELGFAGFQGYFLQHPQTFRARRVPTSRLGMLRLVAALSKEGQSADDIERLIALVALQTFVDRPASLFVSALIRARMCEQLARLCGEKDVVPYFITGLFSMLDAITGMPFPELFDQLPLALSVQRALLSEEGTPGAALACVRAYERGAWSLVTFKDLPPEMIRTAYVDAVLWAEEARALVSA